MTPGIRMTLTILAISFGLIKLELYIQETTGKGLLHGWFKELIIMDEAQDEYLAHVEQSRQMTKAHYNLSQRPIYRTNYPEYVPPCSLRSVLSNDCTIEFGNPLLVARVLVVTCEDSPVGSDHSYHI